MTFWDNRKWYWVRWILVLPSSIFMVFLVSFLFLYMPYSDSKMFDVGDKIGWSSFIFTINGYWFIVSGSKVAPVHKKKTALILIGLFYFLIGIILLVKIQLRNWDSLIIAAISIIGVIIGYMGIEDKKDILEGSSNE